MTKGIRKDNFLTDNFSEECIKFLTKYNMISEHTLRTRNIEYFKQKTNNKDILFQIENWYINN